MKRYHAIVIGVSAGGLEALSTILPGLPRAFSLPVIVVQHRAEDTDGFVAESLNSLNQVRVKEAEDKEPLRAATVYLAPLLEKLAASEAIPTRPRAEACPTRRCHDTRKITEDPYRR